MTQPNTKNRYKILTADHTKYTELTTLWEASVRATHSFLSQDDIVFFKPLIRNQYLKSLKLYYIEVDQEIAGFLGVDAQNIEMLFIAPPYMGKGLGKSLLGYAIKELECNRVDVNEQNPEAQLFYIRNGFIVTGRSETDGTGKPYPLLHMKLVKTGQ